MGLPESRIHYLIVDNTGNILDRLFFHDVSDFEDYGITAGMP